MSRAVRITVGSVVVGVLAFVALVAGIMSASSGFGGDPFGLSTAGVDTPATAEVLDVDDYDDGWPTVDVRWTTPDGEVVVTYVDWEWAPDDLPEVGDRVDVVYDELDPEYAFAADDPYLADGGSEVPADAAEEAGGTAEVAGWVALAALLGVVVGAVVTVVAAVLAPSPQPEHHVPSPFEAPHPHLVGAAPFAPHRYAPQSYAPQSYAPQPYAPQPYAQQPSAPQPHPQPYAPQGGAPLHVPLQAHAPDGEPAGQQWPHPG